MKASLGDSGLKIYRSKGDDGDAETENKRGKIFVREEGGGRGQGGGG